MAAMPIFDGVDDAVEYIYNYVMDSSNKEELDTIWIRSPCPFVIELSLQTIQDTMRGDTWVNPYCFDLAVCKLTSDTIQRNAGTYFVGSTHVFDLRFHRLARVLIQTSLGQAERTNLLINNVIVRPLPKYDVLMTPSIYLLPLYLVDSSYGLLADSIQLRKHLLVQMLMIKGNEAAGNIPAEITTSLRFLDE
ncbi:hypothetical protein VPH35_004845 [Triticum aestivum]